MITPVKQHPLMEVIARKLSGIESVPRTAQARMVSAACHAARKWHEDEIERLRKELERITNDRNNQRDRLRAAAGHAERLRARVAELEAEVESSRNPGSTRIRQIKVSPTKIRAVMKRATKNSKTWVVWKDQKPTKKGSKE